MLTEPVSDASAWRGADLARNREWAIALSGGQLAELDRALNEVKRRGLTLQSVTKNDFALTRLATDLRALSDELNVGRGSFVLRGLPVDRYSPEDNALVFYGIGLHLGIPCAQSARGDVLGHVRDEGHADFRGTENLRGYQTRGGLPYHTDHVDIVGLLCLSPAKEGGLSSIVSSPAVHDEILRNYREYLGLLYKDYFYHFRGEQAAGGAGAYRSPLFTYENGVLTCKTANVDYIYQAPEVTGVPLSEPELEALDLFQRLAGDPALRLDMELEPGDMQFLHNSVILHARTGYVDYDEPERKRHLLRLWLNDPAGRRHRVSSWQQAREMPQPAG